MQTIKIVEDILREFPKTRDDDFLLVIHTYIRLGYAKKTPNGILINYKNIEDAPSFESITRLRRKIQNEDNQFLPSLEIQEKRIKYEKKNHYQFKSKITADNFPNSCLSW